LAMLFWIIMAWPLLEPTLHVAHRDPQWWQLMKEGKKTVEARLHDRKRQAYHPGDTVQVNNREDNNFFLAEIVELIPRSSFADLLRDVPAADLGFRDSLHGLQEIRRYYSPQQEADHGVVGIRVIVLDQ